jgi:hypothetical protein
MLDHELTTMDAREGILGAIRATMSGEFILVNLTWTAWKIRVAQSSMAWVFRH